MKLWMRKIAVAIIAILTLGIYTPTYLLTDEENNEVVSPKASDDGLSNVNSTVQNLEELDFKLASYRNQDYLQGITEQAKDQTIAKLGPRIFEKVEDEFMTDILPKVEETLQHILSESRNENLAYFSITEQPAEGYGERIFNVYDNQLKKDLARFHVRRDNRPQEGYWFNFHYHLNDDGFEHHYTIGEIYWDKNTPPKWMA